MAEINALPVAQIVGALACQKDSYLRSLVTRVVSCTKSAPPAESKSSKSKSKTAANDSETAKPQETWEIECEDSVLFPEGARFPEPRSRSPLISFRWRTTNRSWIARLALGYIQC